MLLLSNVALQIGPAFQTGLTSITFPVTVGLAVVGSIWFYRAGQNVDQLGAVGRTWSPVWGALGWFIPVANIIIPYLYTREVWKASDPLAGPDDWRSRAVPAWVGLWWVLWGGAQAVGMIGAVAGAVVGFRAGLEGAAAGTEPVLVLPTWLVVFGWMQVGLVAAAYPLFVRLLHALEERQRHRGHRLFALQQKQASTPPTGTF